MINEIFVTGYPEMRRIIPTLSPETVIISIRDDDAASLFPNPRPNTLELVFDDDDPGIWAPSGISLTEVLYFNDEMAGQILDFIEPYAKSEDARVLYVHCMVGCARSPAVARAIMEFYGTDDTTCLTSSPYISPNHWVEKLLYREYRRRSAGSVYS